jgi:hypothetical protein
MSSSKSDCYTDSRSIEAMMMAVDQDEIEKLREDADYWRAEAERLRGLLDQRTTAPVPTNPDTASLLTNYEFLSDCCRFAEGILSEQAVRKKYHFFNDKIWKDLGANDALVEKIEAEKVRRIRDGSAKREKAQQLVVSAPDVLNTIMTDPKTSPKHKIDSAKVLDAFAANGPTTAPELDRFSIVINLGNDYKLRFDKSIAPNPHDGGEIIDGTAQGVTAAIEDKNDGLV